jgi:hypothetical protein
MESSSRDMIKDRDIGLVAGIVEGEGHIRFEGTPLIHIAMTDYDVMHRMAVFFDCDIHIANRGHKEVYKINVCSNKAASWMFTLFTLLGERRRKQITDCIIEWKKHPFGKNSPRKPGMTWQ